MIRRPRPEQRWPGESRDDHLSRIRPWRAMIDAATELKNAQSRTATALDRLRAVQDRPHPDEDWAPAVPASQRGRIAAWVAELADISARLEQLDADAWKDAVRAEILPEAGR